MTNNQNFYKGGMVIYTSPEGKASIDVRLEAETLWLSQKMMAELFDKDSDTIGLHLKNIYSEEELEEKATTEFFSVVQTEGKRQVTRRVKFYNLDAILSVGYRVNSKRGTQFRIWANRILKEHLVQGYTINQKRLVEQQNQIARLRESIQLVERSLLEHVDTIDDARKVVKVLSEFAQGLRILDDYDHETLEQAGKTVRPAALISENEFLNVVRVMRRDFESAVFGQPKDNSFSSSVNQIYQSFGGSELYPSIEHKAAMLLYFVVKNHSFVDGNKRIAAALFLYFLQKNGILDNPDGHQIISNDGLAALTLLIAVSKPEEKDTMVKIVITVLNRSYL
jgi:prophage maintenance system killer protein